MEFLNKEDRLFELYTYVFWYHCKKSIKFFVMSSYKRIWSIITPLTRAITAQHIVHILCFNNMWFYCPPLAKCLQTTKPTRSKRSAVVPYTSYYYITLIGNNELTSEWNAWISVSIQINVALLCARWPIPVQNGGNSFILE